MCEKNTKHRATSQQTTDSSSSRNLPSLCTNSSWKYFKNCVQITHRKATSEHTLWDRAGDWQNASRKPLRETGNSKIRRYSRHRKKNSSLSLSLSLSLSRSIRFLFSLNPNPKLGQMWIQINVSPRLGQMWIQINWNARLGSSNMNPDKLKP